MVRFEAGVLGALGAWMATDNTLHFYDGIWWWSTSGVSESDNDTGHDFDYEDVSGSQRKEEAPTDDVPKGDVDWFSWLCGRLGSYFGRGVRSGFSTLVGVVDVVGLHLFGTWWTRFMFVGAAAVTSLAMALAAVLVSLCLHVVGIVYTSTRRLYNLARGVGLQPDFPSPLPPCPSCFTIGWALRVPRTSPRSMSPGS